MSEMEEQENNNAQSQAKKDEKYDCFIEGLDFAVLGDPAINQLYHKSYFGYLDGQKLLLEREEVILLLERGRIRVLDGKRNEKELKEIIKLFTTSDPAFWSNYLVYKDLRERGYLVRKAPSQFTTYKVYSRGSSPEETPARKIVLPMVEGMSLELEDLDMAVKSAISGKKKLLLGVVDRVGDVTYYEASQLEPSKNFP
ncbi:MAG: tRNA-intron lyase [Candidatus Odinarchaeota archaeon]